jgi:hypothetical protein
MVSASYTVVAILPDGSQLPESEVVAHAIANALGPHMPDQAYLAVSCPNDDEPIGPGHPAFEL